MKNSLTYISSFFTLVSLGKMLCSLTSTGYDILPKFPRRIKEKLKKVPLVFTFVVSMFLSEVVLSAYDHDIDCELMVAGGCCTAIAEGLSEVAWRWHTQGGGYYDSALTFVNHAEFHCGGANGGVDLFVRVEDLEDYYIPDIVWQDWATEGINCNSGGA